MKRLKDYTQSRFMASGLAVLMMALFLALPFNTAAAPQDYYIEFGADPTQIQAGQCTTVYWHTENVQAVYYQGQGVSGIHQTRLECPSYSTTYDLLVITRDNQQVSRQIYVEVVEPWNNWENWNERNTYYNNVIVDFWADRNQIRAGECVNIHWNTSNVQAVYFEGDGVSGIHQTRVECPNSDRTYDLQVRTRDNQVINKQIYVSVTGGRADRGELTMKPGQAVDVDNGGRVSDHEDDFRWFWDGHERGRIVKASNDSDLELTAVGHHDTASQFNRMSENDCRQELDDDHHGRIDVDEGTLVCFRTDSGNYGKFLVEDIRSTNGRLKVEWSVWD